MVFFLLLTETWNFSGKTDGDRYFKGVRHNAFGWSSRGHTGCGMSSEETYLPLFCLFVSPFFEFSPIFPRFSCRHLQKLSMGMTKLTGRNGRTSSCDTLIFWRTWLFLISSTTTFTFCLLCVNNNNNNIHCTKTKTIWTFMATEIIFSLNKHTPLCSLINDSLASHFVPSFLVNPMRCMYNLFDYCAICLGNSMSKIL